MSVTIQIAGQDAVLADGTWHSALPEIAKVLNSHLESVQLEVPGHWPPRDREIKLARLACKAFAAEVIDSTLGPGYLSRALGGQRIVF